VSFLIVGIIWLNHHATVQLLARTDHGEQVLNLLLLLPVSVLPWPTAVLAEYTRHGTASDHRVAVLLYGGTSTAMAVAFNVFWRYLLRHPKLHRPGAAQAAVVLARDERLRLLAGSALGRRTDESQQSAAGVDDPRRHDQSLQVSGHGRGPDGGLQSVESAYLDVQVLLDGAGELSGLRRLDDLVDGAAAGVAQLMGPSSKAPSDARDSRSIASLLSKAAIGLPGLTPPVRYTSVRAGRPAQPEEVAESELVGRPVPKDGERPTLHHLRARSQAVHQQPKRAREFRSNHLSALGGAGSRGL